MTSERRMAAAALLISVFVAGIVGGSAVMAMLRGPSWHDRFEGRDRGRGTACLRSRDFRSDTWKTISLVNSA